MANSEFIDHITTLLKENQNFDPAIWKKSTTPDTLVLSDRIFSSGSDIFINIHDKAFNSPPAMLHTHDFFELIYVFQGNCTFYTSSKNRRLNPGNIIMMNTNLRHGISVDSADDIVFNILIAKKLAKELIFSMIPQDSNLNVFFMNALFSPKAEEQLVSFNIDEDSERYVQLLIEENARKAAGYQYVSKCYLGLLFASQLRNQSFFYETGENSHYAVLSKVYEYLHNHPSTCTLKELSGELHYSPNYVSALIRDYTSKSFSSLLQEIRMEKAADLLLQTDISINEIVEQTGFYDRSHFNKAFKAYYHINPGEYRSSNR